jgi:hypothetical protein
LDRALDFSAFLFNFKVASLDVFVVVHLHHDDLVVSAFLPQVEGLLHIVFVELDQAVLEVVGELPRFDLLELSPVVEIHA